MVKNSDGKERIELKKHHRIGKKLFSPLGKMVEEGKIKLVSWQYERLPHVLWACLVASILPRSEALQIFKDVSEFGLEFRGQHQTYVGIDITHEGLLFSPEKILIFRIVKRVISFSQGYEALRPLLLIKSLPGLNIWQQALSTDEAPETDWNVLAQAVGKTLDHQSQETTDVRWLRVMFKMALGMVNVLPNMQKTMNEIIDYPLLTEGELQKTRPMIRAMEGAFSKFETGEISSSNKLCWSDLFWKECLMKSDCMPLIRRKPKLFDIKSILENIFKVRKNLLRVFFDSLETTRIDSKHDSIFGIAFYALTLLRELLESRQSQGIIGRLIIKTLVECHITLSYLLSNDKNESWEKFRQYGISQSKLSLLKLFEMGDDRPSFITESTLEQLANQDKSEDFVVIDFGHWAGKDLRTLAEESKTKEDYDRYYGWSSTYSHAQWVAINDVCFATCFNPLHQLHRIPLLGKSNLECSIEDTVDLVNKILSSVQKIYPKFSEKIEISV